MVRAVARFLALSLACVAALWWTTAQAGPVMGSGLRQLVNAWETADPRLPAQMDLHLKDQQGNPLVHVKLQPGMTVDQVLPALQAAGFRLNAVSLIDPTQLDGYLPLAQARGAASLPGVRSLHAVQKPRRNAGSVQSQAVALQKADVAQAHGFDGRGIRVGVLSDSYDACPSPDCSTHAADDIRTGDLPAEGVTVVEDLPPDSGSDEGRAMLQLIHDVAPGSKLGFATAVVSELDFANNIIRLRSEFNADVIVDDIVYFDEPMFSDGVVAQAVDIVARDGAAYFSAAGNNGLEAFEGIYTPIPFALAQLIVATGRANVKLDQIPPEIRPNSVHVFSGIEAGELDINITQRFSSAAPNFISFQWDEPFLPGKVKTDFNIYVFDANGNWMDPASLAFPGFYTTDDNTLTDAAFEFVFLPPFPGEMHGGANVSDYQIVIGKVNDGPARHIKYVNVNGLGVSQFQNAPSVFGHAAAQGAQAVAAMYYAITDFPEDFSSPGPVTIHFDTAGKRLRVPQIRSVPQLTAADGVDTTFFGFDIDGNGLPNFSGTSASAPNAAAVGALALQAAGGPGSLRPSELYRLLQKTATRVPVPNDRSQSAGKAGPVDLNLQGDWTRWANYFGLAVGGTRHSVAAVSLDLSNTGLVWSLNPDRFHVGDSNGIVRADIRQSVSADQTVMTLTFAPGRFHAGQSFRFGMSAFSPILGTTQVDPDRFRDMKITALLDNGQTFKGTVRAEPSHRVNRFTGAGLVNAAAAVRAIREHKHEHKHEHEQEELVGEQ
jgi:hypothetical protein